MERRTKLLAPAVPEVPMRERMLTRAPKQQGLQHSGPATWAVQAATPMGRLDHQDLEPRQEPQAPQKREVRPGWQKREGLRGQLRARQEREGMLGRQAQEDRSSSY